MSVTADQIIVFAATYMPENDTDVCGGAINSGVRVVFDDIVATDQVEIYSSDTSDSGTINITGRDGAGIIQTSSMAISGTTIATLPQTFERILKIVYQQAPVGVITVRSQDADTIIATLASGVTGIRRPFYDATANAAGGANKTLYEKVYIMNTNPTTALTNVQVTEVSSGLYSKIDFGLENSLNSTGTISDRTTTPTGVSGYGNGPSGIIEGGNLPNLQYQGMWLRLQLNAGDAAQNSFYQFQVTGTTT
jgi:hypothetical protein